MYWREFIPKSWLYLHKEYSFDKFRSDLFSGITVGIISLPLAMAFAIASGLPPISGIYTSIIAGFVIAVLGGSAFQISGPTGAFIVVIYGIVQQMGYEGLVVATLLAGLILIMTALFRVGTLIKFIPYPLVTGFTTGIAVIILSTQVKDFFGLRVENLPADFIPKIGALYGALATWNLITTLVATGTLILIILIRKYLPVLPWGITSIAITTLFCSLFAIPVDTIFSRYGEIPSTLAPLSLPHFHLLFSDWFGLIQSAIAIAFLAGVESLLSAVVADGMTGRNHKSNCELLAQGVGNIASVLFGGIPATGAIARTAMNIKSGAKSPLSGMIHALTLLLIIFFFAPIVSRIPLSAIAAVLVVVAWNMSELHHFCHLFNAPGGDIAVLIVTFLLTVLVDLILAIEVGMLLAGFLFMKRIRDLTKVQAVKILDEKETDKPDPDAIEKKHIPHGVSVYEVTGLFFFGLADSLKSVVAQFSRPPKVFILRLRKLPVIDASGMHALREFYSLCAKDKTVLILSGVGQSVYNTLDKFGLVRLIGKENICHHIDPALERAKEISAETLESKAG